MHHFISRSTFNVCWKLTNICEFKTNIRKAKVTEASKMRLCYLRNLVKFRQNEIGYNAYILITSWCLVNWCVCMYFVSRMMVEKLVRIDPKRNETATNMTAPFVVHRLPGASVRFLSHSGVRARCTNLTSGSLLWVQPYIIHEGCNLEYSVRNEKLLGLYVCLVLQDWNTGGYNRLFMWLGSGGKKYDCFPKLTL